MVDDIETGSEITGTIDFENRLPVWLDEEHRRERNSHNRLKYPFTKMKTNTHSKFNYIMHVKGSEDYIHWKFHFQLYCVYLSLSSLLLLLLFLLFVQNKRMKYSVVGLSM